MEQRQSMFQGDLDGLAGRPLEQPEVTQDLFQLPAIQKQIRKLVKEETLQTRRRRKSKHTRQERRELAQKLAVYNSRESQLARQRKPSTLETSCTSTTETSTTPSPTSVEDFTPEPLTPTSLPTTSAPSPIML